MRLLLACLLAACTGCAYADGPTASDSVTFIQYLDENTALEEVRSGNLDIYYSRIPSDRIEDHDARAGLQVFDSTGGSYSILVNPAESDVFNPFSAREARFALNYLVDRKLIVNELMGGYGSVMISNYGPYDPDYLVILEQLESFDFEYNPALADRMMSGSLASAGAERIGGAWIMDGEPVEITIFIRSDDPVRKSIGEILASELEDLGFSVVRDYGDLNKAFVVVYGSDPADLRWSLYTEGWGGSSAFVKYDHSRLGQMYSPWFSNMPGFNDPSYWNYRNDRLDNLTQRIFSGDFASVSERTGLVQEAVLEGIHESVRIFLAGRIDQYVANDGVSGVINDFGAGVPSRFTPINSRGDSDSLRIGVKQIYQGAWNPVMGLTDSYSVHIWNTLHDPGMFKHPYTGGNIPIRSGWDVETRGPDGGLDVPPDAIMWDPVLQQWAAVGPGTQAVSRVTFDFLYGNWHHGQAMDINDILYSYYFVSEWGSEQTADDKTFDSEYTPRRAQTVDTLVGIRPVDADTLEVYVDYWHFDESEIAYWASGSSAVPWELVAAMEQVVTDGKASFSRSGSVSKGVGWLSLIVPHDAMMIRGAIESFESVPRPLEGLASDAYAADRYGAMLGWIDSYNHAVVSNGPFYLERYSPESRTIRVHAFADETYPFESGEWSRFEDVRFPAITGVAVPDVVRRGSEVEIPVSTEHATRLHYFFTSSAGGQAHSGVAYVDSPTVLLSLSGGQTAALGDGANDLKIFAISDEVLRPDMYETSFLAVDADVQALPEVSIHDVEPQQGSQPDLFILPAVIILAVCAVLLVRRRAARKHAAVRRR